MKKLTTLVLAVLIGLAMALPALAAAENPVVVSRLQELGIMTGDEDGDLRLQDNITRAEFAKMAVGLYNAKYDNKMIGGGTSLKFSDVVKDGWYVEHINAAVALGLMKGDPEGTFRPNGTVTCAEVQTVLLRVLGYDDSVGDGIWPQNYLALAKELGMPGVITEDGGSLAAVVANRYYVAESADWMLDAPLHKTEPDTEAAVKGYGVVMGIADGKITINDKTYTTAGFDFGSTKPEVGLAAAYSANKAGQLLSFSTRNVRTNNLHEAKIANGKIELNGKDYAFTKDAEVWVVNKAGACTKLEVEKLLESTYAASLRSSGYYVPLQYVLAGTAVEYLVIGDYAGLNGQHFGFIESIGTNADGVAVSFFGDKTAYGWENNDEEPQENVLYAYGFKAGGVDAYAVNTDAEQIKNGVVTQDKNICLAKLDDGEVKSFIVNDDTVILEVKYVDGKVDKCEIIDSVEVDDIVRVRYVAKTGSGDTGLEAAYIIVDATNK